MIPMQKIGDQWQQVRGNPIIKSLDGKTRAPMRVILHESWTPEDRAAYGIYELRQADPPEGYMIIKTNYMFDSATKLVSESHEIEPAPQPEDIPVQTDRIRRHDGSNRPRPVPPPPSE